MQDVRQDKDCRMNVPWVIRNCLRGLQTGISGTRCTAYRGDAGRRGDDRVGGGVRTWSTAGRTVGD